MRQQQDEPGRFSICSRQAAVVHQTLSESQVDNEVASKWIKELVGSYTKSLDLSGGLVEEHTLDTIACIRAEAKLNKPSIEPGNN
ncbi:hypothetical protein SNC80_13460 [Escherichia coli]|nr:hypothetical protein [Escherichia coli]